MVAAAADIDPEEAHRRALARRSALEDLAEDDLCTFIELHTPQYDRPEHLEPLTSALDRSMHEPVYALVEVAPRFGKTETLLHGAARRLRYRGGDNLFYCSYSSPFALRKSRKCREIASRAGVWAGDDELRARNRFDPSSAVSYWQTSDGGSFTAGGRRGAFTGDGYNFGIFDDPYKGRAEAESEKVQEAVIETWQGTLANRIEPGGSVFITHQAWNDQDIIATLKAGLAPGHDGQRWELISLPAVIDAKYDPNTGALIGGIPLWPARWSLEALARKKHDVGDYNWYSQYTNDRLPPGTRVFHDPARYVEPRIDGAVVMISCDPGLEDDKMKDSSGIVVGSLYHRASPFHTPQAPHLELAIDVLLAEDQWRDTPDLLDYLELLQRTMFRGAPVLLEEVSAFKALSQMARRLNPKLQLYPITPRGSKLLRARPAAKAWNTGRIRTPINAPWVVDFHREAQRFTGRAGGKDNRVDALTQLFDYADLALNAAGGAEIGGDRLESASSPF
jgi:hypothetical protein